MNQDELRRLLRTEVRTMLREWLDEPMAGQPAPPAYPEGPWAPPVVRAWVVAELALGERGRARDWLPRFLADHPEEVPAHWPVKRFGQALASLPVDVLARRWDRTGVRWYARVG